MHIFEAQICLFDSLKKIESIQAQHYFCNDEAFKGKNKKGTQNTKIKNDL